MSGQPAERGFIGALATESVQWSRYSEIVALVRTAWQLVPAVVCKEIVVVQSAWGHHRKLPLVGPIHGSAWRSAEPVARHLIVDSWSQNYSPPAEKSTSFLIEPGIYWIPSADLFAFLHGSRMPQLTARLHPVAIRNVNVGSETEPSSRTVRNALCHLSSDVNRLGGAIVIYTKSIFVAVYRHKLKRVSGGCLQDLPCPKPVSLDSVLCGNLPRLALSEVALNTCQRVQCLYICLLVTCYLLVYSRPFLIPTSRTSRIGLTAYDFGCLALAVALPNLTGLNSLEPCQNVDLSNNSFPKSEAPAWFSTLQSLTTLLIEYGPLEGSIPSELFSLPQIQQVKLRNNAIGDKLDMSGNIGQQLQLVDLEDNNISSVTLGSGYRNTTNVTVHHHLCS
ncbi:hypothetical protein Sango_2944400 [Sesamum angolense]|uniref:Uncharacterized protein n=1 Tax=Sesamum angolense TaxID=2727404 RepID=A0AAE1T549_9LAMI|nr:hypothetical protein Sango_2944400 [Sesamum angolense]